MVSYSFQIRHVTLAGRYRPKVLRALYGAFYPLDS